MPSDVERGDELHQRIDIAADHAVARLHALDGRQRQPGRFSKLALVDAEKRAGRSELAGCDHGATSKMMFNVSVFANSNYVLMLQSVFEAPPGA